MEVSCGGFSCQERHKNVVVVSWGEMEKEAKGEIMVRTESNKNMMDLLGTMQGEGRERENREMGHSTDVWTGLLYR